MTFDPSALCVPVPEYPKPLCLTLPGGAEVCPSTGELPPALFTFAKIALGAANSAMAPLAPIFTIIEVITSIQKCLAAVPGIVGPPPDPSKLVQALEDLAEKMSKLLQLIPQLSVPLMVVQLIDIIIATIDGAASEMTSLARFLATIQQAEFLAAQAPGLNPIALCARSSLEMQMSNIEASFASINPIIDLVNMLGALAGLKPLPSFEGGLPADPTQGAQRLQAVADTLRVFRSAIPV